MVQLARQTLLANAASMSERIRIVVPADSPAQVQGSPHLALLEPLGDVKVYNDRPRTQAEQVERARGAAVLINSHGSVKWPREVLEQLPGLRLISLCSVGTDCVDLDAARELGITVCNQGGKTAPIVAEHEFALMLAVAKRLAEYTISLKAGGWGGKELVTLRGKTAGIVGTGNSGRTMAELCRAIGMNVVAWTFTPDQAWAKEKGIRYASFDEVLRESDVVSLHVGLSERTRHLIGAEQFAMMKRGAIFVNGSRGPVVDTNALLAALQDGTLYGAGLDVFEEEPLPPGHPILTFENVVLTPHIADATPEGFEGLNIDAIENVVAFLEGRPQNVVT